MKNTDLSRQVATLPTELATVLKQLAAAAQVTCCRLYLVGGVTRDLLLGHHVHDADIVILGEAATVAKALPSIPGKLVLYPAFGTATIAFGHFHLDISSARTEIYAQPGALPTVRPGTLADDLRRRDFTINTMAISLNTDDYGQLIDICGGQADLKARLIRALHERSFADDPTRIWRAVRYEQRLGYNIEPDTLSWLKRDLIGLNSLTGDRVWHELERLLQEEAPERGLVRLGKLGVLQRLSPTIRADNWLMAKYQATRAEGEASLSVYLALLTYRLKAAAAEALAEYLHLKKPLRQIMRDIQDLKTRLPVLARPYLKPSTLYHHLCGHATEALETVFIASPSPTVQCNITRYQHNLKRIKTAITGDDLISLGVPPGANVGTVLQKLLEARLDGHVKNRAEELALAQSLITR